MKHFFKNPLILLLALITLWSCSDDDDNGDGDGQQPDDTTIVDLAIDTADLSSLVAALQKADENDGTDLVAALSGAGPFTVFAPTNDAFSELLAGLDGFSSLDDFDTDEERDLLAAILTYHVVSGAAVESSTLTDGQVITTLQGETLTVSVDGDDIDIEDATDEDADVDMPDVEASNGIVHVIDKVLLPQAVLDALNSSEPTANIVETAIATDALSSLVAALQKADENDGTDLVAALSGDGPFTVFAPTNDAFTELLASLDGFSSLDDFDTDEERDLLAAILTYHVVTGAAVESSTLTDGQVITTLQGETLTASVDGDDIDIEDATDEDADVDMPDVATTNGIVHVIDKVLLPQAVLDVLNAPTANIVETAIATDALSSLVAALQKADENDGTDLVAALSGEGPFTVFAPTNDAFTALLASLDGFDSLDDFDTDEERDLLAAILTYHVVTGAAVESSTLTDGQVIPTLQGESLTASVDGNDIDIEDATDEDADVDMPDVATTNGIVHVIDKVLIPQAVLDAL